MALNELQASHNTGKNDRPHVLLKEATELWLHPGWQYEFKCLTNCAPLVPASTGLTTDFAHSSGLGQKTLITSTPNNNNRKYLKQAPIPYEHC